MAHFCTIRPLVDEKTLLEVAASQHVAMFFQFFEKKNEKLTAHIFDLRPHKWVCLKMGIPVRRVLRHTPVPRVSRDTVRELVFVLSWHDLNSGEVCQTHPIA